LGNQMSQYAFYLAKKQRDSRTRCIHYPDPLTCQHNGYELDRIFGIQPDGWKGGLWGRLLDAYSWSQVCASRKRNWLRWLMNKFNVEKVKEPSFDYCPEMLTTQKNAYRFYEGGWHQPAYMRDVEDEVRKAFQFDLNKLGELNNQCLAEINGCNSVSLHVRRGDFLKETTLFGNIATPAYYNKALAYIRERVKKPVFYVFSDDIDWCRENIREDAVRFVDWNTGEDAWKDMLLMSRCKHNINANSTFAWWGAWLNTNPDKIVVVPDRFMNRPGSDRIYPEEWVKIQRDE